METDVMSFSGMFSKTSNGGPGPVGGQQKVVCTPEVSLYQYPSKMKEGIVAIENEDGEKVGGFVCNLCGKTFHQKNTFQNHLRSHREGDDPYQCDICHKTFAVPARLTRHYRTHTGEKPYQCEYCNKSFSVKENLSVHRRIHTKERPYKCDVCERAFEHSGKLHRHMRIHTGERPHRCNICQKTFIQSGQLVIHMRTHTGEKPYVCKVCNKGFTCSKQLKVHTRTHTGEKPYTCDICGKSFGYNHVLKLHQVAHYGEKVYKCTLCNGTFNSKKSLESHIKTHSGESVNPGHITPPPSEPADSMSPQSSVYQTTPQHSDKENRGDASDSEISSQSSPPVGESPKSPGSPVQDYVKSLPEAIQHVKMMSQSGSAGSKAGLPYPMLPPSVEVRQAPQSGTTFLYVTSKLPPHGYPGNQVKTVNNGPYSPPSQPRVITTNSLNLKTLQMGLNSPPAKETVDFNQNASIREKVLASIEKFGYGLSTNGISISPATRHLHGSQPEYQRQNGFRRETENLSKFPTTDVSISEVPHIRNRSRSPENSNYPGSFGHGGVLALALTRGSKAVVNMQNSQPSFPHLPSVTIRPRTISESTHPSRFDSPPHSDRSSPEIISDLHRRSVSPPGGMNLAYHRPTPSSTPGSSAGYSENNEDFSSDDYPHQPHSPLAGEKRRNSGSPCYGGPRKRSSLILEKYAQENSPPPASSSSPKPASPPSPPVCPKESILSQRLRMSSVIQYAEKCT